MAVMTGALASVRLAAVVITELKDWSLDGKAEPLENPKFRAAGDASLGWKSSIAGAREWSGAFSGGWNAKADTTGQKLLEAAYLAGTTVALRLYVDATHYYSGTAYVVGMNTKAPADGLVEVDYSFQGTGALLYT